MDQKQHAKEILLRLKDKYPTVSTALKYSNAHELLFAVILSAQCTDKRVNIVTLKLFSKYVTLEDYANSNLEELKEIIRSTGFYNNKAKNIQNSAKMLLENFDGQVPGTIAELVKLPGVARKTANVMLSVWFGKNEGIAVDTHVGRLSRRLGLTEEKDPVKVEHDLVNIVPNKELNEFGLRLIQHGRDTCHSRKPECAGCVLRDICPSRRLET